MYMLNRYLVSAQEVHKSFANWFYVGVGEANYAHLLHHHPYLPSPLSAAAVRGGGRLHSLICRPPPPSLPSISQGP